MQRSETKETIRGFFGVAKSMMPRVFGECIADSVLPPAPYRPNSPLLGMDGFGKRPLKVAPATLNEWLAAADGANETEKR